MQIKKQTKKKVSKKTAAKKPVSKKKPAANKKKKAAKPGSKLVKLQLTRRRLMGIWNTISFLLQGAGNIKLQYGLAKNKRILKDEMDPVAEAQALLSEFFKYESERVEVCMKFAKSDDEGEPIKVGNEYVIDPDQQQSFDKAIKKLKRKHAKGIKANKDFAEILDQEVAVELYSLPLSSLPEEIAGQHLDAIFEIIEDDTE